MADNARFISLTAAVDNPEELQVVFGKFQDLAEELTTTMGEDVAWVSLSSSITPDELSGQEYLDENTTFKVRDALLRAGLDVGKAEYAIGNILSDGILFREKRK